VIENTPNGKFEQLKSPSSSSVLLLLFEEENNQEVQVVAELDDDGMLDVSQDMHCYD
jgi:hypothetical protein